jgi:hypothetical protein
VSFLNKIFGKNKKKTIQVDGLGEFLYCDDGSEKYWQVERPGGNLPSGFNFGAITGGQEGPNIEALESFRFFSDKPDNLYSYINEMFFSKLEPRFGILTIKDVQSKFYLKSLTCTSKEEFEFGYHSNEYDIFIELFSRRGVVTEVHLDEGCCENG